ncbi:MAG: sugar phosphate nucleotidyltransferase, partial [Gammaproteobacteria bacterium]
VLILAGDHVYKMDYGPMIAYHVAKGADLTIGAIEVPVEQAKAFGVMEVDDDWQVAGFAEKPDNPQSTPGNKDTALVSMGIYIFNTLFLYEELIRDSDISTSTHDFGKDLNPRIIDRYRTVAYPFRDEKGEQAYWRDVGTVDAFWAANMELIGVTPELNLYDQTWPIWTYQAQLPPAKFVFDDDNRRGMAIDSMVSGGCIISGAEVRHSLLFSNVVLNEGASLCDCVVLPDAEVGKNCRLRKVVVDKFCHIPDGMVIGENLEEDAERFYVSPEGVVLVIPEMLGDRRRYVR